MEDWHLSIARSLAVAGYWVFCLQIVGNEFDTLELECSAREAQHGRMFSQVAQKGLSARPQRVKAGGVPSGAYGATNEEHHVCVRCRVGEAAGSPLRI